MNVPFRIAGGDRVLSSRLVIQSKSKSKGLFDLRALTPTGIGDYLRAGLYNSVALEDTRKLADVMHDFAQGNS